MNKYLDLLKNLLVCSDEETIQYVNQFATKSKITIDFS